MVIPSVSGPLDPLSENKAKAEDQKSVSAAPSELKGTKEENVVKDALARPSLYLPPSPELDGKRLRRINLKEYTDSSPQIAQLAKANTLEDFDKAIQGAESDTLKAHFHLLKGQFLLHSDSSAEASTLLIAAIREFETAAKTLSSSKEL